MQIRGALEVLLIERKTTPSVFGRVLISIRVHGALVRERHNAGEAAEFISTWLDCSYLVYKRDYVFRSEMGLPPVLLSRMLFAVYFLLLRK